MSTQSSQRDTQLQQLLLHACSCASDCCPDLSCNQMKLLKQHILDCKISSCIICKDMSSLIHTHAATCTKEQCPVPSCALYRSILSQRNLHAAHDMLRQLMGDYKAHQEMFQSKPDNKPQIIVEKARDRHMVSPFYSPSSSGKSMHNIPRSPYLRQTVYNCSSTSDDRGVDIQSQSPYTSSSYDSSDGYERDDALIFLPRQKGNCSMNSSKLSPRTPKKRGRKPKRLSDNIHELNSRCNDKSDSELSATSGYNTDAGSARSEPILLPKRVDEDPSGMGYEPRRLKLARSMSYESDSSASNMGSPVRRSWNTEEDEGMLSVSDTQAHVVDLQDLEVDLRALLCDSPPPRETSATPLAEAQDSIGGTTSSDATPQAIRHDTNTMGEHFDLTLSQLSCDLDDMHVDMGDIKIGTCAAMSPLFEDEEDIFQYLDDDISAV